MSAVEVDVAEAIADELNAEDFGVVFTATRNYADASVLLTDLQTLHVDVVPWKAELELVSRGELEYTVETDILIRQRIGMIEQDLYSGEIPNDVIDDLLELRQKIGEFFAPSQQTNQSGRVLSAMPKAAWQSTRCMASYVRPHLKQNRQFTGWLRVTYSVQRAAGE